MALREHLPHPLYQFIHGFPRDQDSGSIISAWEEQVPTHKPYPNCYWKCWSGRVKDHYMQKKKKDHYMHSFFPRHQVFLIAKSGTYQIDLTRKMKKSTLLVQILAASPPSCVFYLCITMKFTTNHPKQLMLSPGSSLCKCWLLWKQKGLPLIKGQSLLRNKKRDGSGINLTLHACLFNKGNKKLGQLLIEKKKWK